MEHSIFIQHKLEELNSLLDSNRDPERAVAAEAYMKNRFPYFGMDTATRRALQKDWLVSLKSIQDYGLRWELIRALWEREEREFQYVAIDWLRSWPKKYLEEADADELKWLISQKSWWDSVDAIASNYLGIWAERFPEKARETMEEWRYEDSLWLRRSCLIYQLKFKNRVDVAYLEELIAQMLPDKAFFIQKAIGWSLRQLSKYRPEEVRRILNTYPIQGLALREAEKYL